MGMPYCWANVPRSGCRLECCVMLFIHVALEAWTGSFEMSALKTESAGKRGQVVPGTGRAMTAGAVGRNIAPETRRAATARPIDDLMPALTRGSAHDCGQLGHSAICRWARQSSRSAILCWGEPKALYISLRQALAIEGHGRLASDARGDREFPYRR